MSDSCFARGGLFLMVETDPMADTKEGAGAGGRGNNGEGCLRCSGTAVAAARMRALRILIRRSDFSRRSSFLPLFLKGQRQRACIAHPIMVKMMAIVRNIIPIPVAQMWRTAPSRRKFPPTWFSNSSSSSRRGRLVVVVVVEVEATEVVDSTSFREMATSSTSMLRAFGSTVN